jgi:hypothetical protein
MDRHPSMTRDMVTRQGSPMYVKVLPRQCAAYLNMSIAPPATPPLVAVGY